MMGNCRVFRIYLIFLFFDGLSFLLLSETNSTECVINRRSLIDDRQPLILLASTRSWYPLSYSEPGTIRVPENVSLTLVCPRSSSSFNSFAKFQKQNEITAKCITGENFSVGKKTFAFKDLRCLYSLKPTLQVTNQTCLAPNTFNDTSLEPNWIKVFVGYPTNYEFIPVYGVCFDKKKYGTLYSVSTISPEIESDEWPRVYRNWMSDDQLFRHINLDSEYYCPNQTNTFRTILGGNNYRDRTECCFLKSKLVNDDDLIYRPQRIATYHYVNTVPQCHKQNWEEVNKRVRTLSSTLGRPLTVWSGVYRYIKRTPEPGHVERDLYLHYKSERDKAHPLPLFSWKVIYDGISHNISNGTSDKALAVVTINDSKRANWMLNGLVLCQDVCEDVDWMKFHDRKKIDNGYTYCCELKSFLKAFAFTKNSFPKASVGLLQQNEKKTK